MSARNHVSAIDFGLPENIYGHVKRLEWIAAHLRAGDRVLEIGCGTGYMITLPLIRAGWDAMGVDTDQASIDYGRGLLAAEGLDPDRLRSVDAATLPGKFDAVILSEVLEHIPDAGIGALLATVRGLLAPGGRLLVTVPNGYGIFEFETFLWRVAGVGVLLRVTRVESLTHAVKRRLAMGPFDYPHPSSLDSSPHVQRFTLGAITHTLRANGFNVLERTGTVLAGGPISNLFFTGVRSVMRLNSAAGTALPAVATAFMLMAVPTGEDSE
jgi:SAM-dependent methyltransferase